MSEPSLPVSSSTVEFYRPMPGFTARPPKPRYWLYGLLLLLSCFTTLVVGARMESNFVHDRPVLSLDDGSPFPVTWVFAQPTRLFQGLPFAASLMLILMAHEMGHYLFCKRYGVYATLPAFIPAPTWFGTLGAFIRIRSPIRSRTALFDIGIAGPIAGFVVALAVLAVSMTLSRPMRQGLPSPELQLGFPLIFKLMHRLVALGAGNGVASLPMNRVLLHPMAIAAWVGMFATALNLLPGGQLDGGHIVFSLAPGAHKIVSRLSILVLLPLALYQWAGWFVWAVLLQLSSFRHPQVAEWPRVSGSRLGLAVLALVMLAVTWTPAPIGGASVLEVVHQLLGR